MQNKIAVLIQVRAYMTNQEIAFRLALPPFASAMPDLMPL